MKASYEGKNMAKKVAGPAIEAPDEGYGKDTMDSYSGELMPNLTPKKVPWSELSSKEEKPLVALGQQVIKSKAGSGAGGL